ncbi:hypothetical protein NOI24_03580 [Neorhizobium galegae]|jgi:hypothetical protein|uniref:hypothetical protein n=1 Tax=Neorhizobium galegae TaxID=399 RepID=UPI0021074641|nr:hypothetical protein [Neorhizobium galegae]MCQ1770366.1 hypothetical protein [Neorhizobium galegae]MCQ1799687.1 hypothetical protein [Neorhizobium galegae]
MSKFNDPQVVDELHMISGKLSAEVEKALASEQYQELARLHGIQQGLILAIDIARGKSVKVPQNRDAPFLGAAIATLEEDG